MIEIWNMGNLELGKLGIRNCGNWELWKSVIVEIGNMEIINFWNETKMLSSLLQVLPTWPLCRERERYEYSWQLFIEMMVIHSGMAMASNSMDQHTYSRIASLVIVELDCIQFDFIH